MRSSRPVNFITNGFGVPSNYTPAGPMGNQFAAPYGDPYRVQAVSGIWDVFTGIASSVGKFIAPVLPGVAQVGVSSLLAPKPIATAQATSQSAFTQATGQTQAQIDAAKAEKANTGVYIAVGVVALAAAYYFISKRRRK